MALVNGGDNLLTHRDQPLKRLFIVPESIEGRQNEEAVKRRVVFMGAHKDAAGRGGGGHGRRGATSFTPSFLCAWIRQEEERPVQTARY